MGPQDTDDPHEWPDSALLSVRDLISMLGQGAHTLLRAPDFPEPTPVTTRHGRRINYWRVGDVRHWEKTHCIYGSRSQSCTRPRVTPDPDHLGLCREHRDQARQILKRKDNQ